MSTLELKKKIKGRLEKIEDEQFLKLIYRFVLNKENTNPPPRLSEKQKASIKQGIEDVKAGRVTNDEDFQKELDQWLEKEK